MIFSEADIARYHAAAKMIEVDGTEGIRTCAARFGWDLALAVLVAKLRRDKGSESSYPAPPEVEDEVNQILRDIGLLQQ